MREKVQSVHEKKKIVHKAIDTSFANRTNFPRRKLTRVENLERKMLTDSIYEMNKTAPEIWVSTDLIFVLAHKSGHHCDWKKLNINK